MENTIQEYYNYIGEITKLYRVKVLKKSQFDVGKEVGMDSSAVARFERNIHNGKRMLNYRIFIYYIMQGLDAQFIEENLEEVKENELLAQK